MGLDRTGVPAHRHVVAPPCHAVQVPTHALSRRYHMHTTAHMLLLLLNREEHQNLAP